MFRCRNCGAFTDLNYCDKCNTSDASIFYLTLARKSASGIIKSSTHWTKAFRKRFVQYTNVELADILFNDRSRPAIAMVSEAKKVLATRYWYPTQKKQEEAPSNKQIVSAYFVANTGNSFFAQTGGTLAEPVLTTYRLNVLAGKPSSVKFWVEVLDSSSATGYTPLGAASIIYTDTSTPANVIVTAVKTFTKSDNIRLHIM